jgi:hypothetical protein
VIDPASVLFYHPPEINRGPKLELFKRIRAKIEALGGKATQDFHDLGRAPSDVLPVVGCSPQLTPMIAGWRERGRRWVYWDRGYWQRCYATWLPRGTNGGMYRWHVGAFQLEQLRSVPDDRLRARTPPVGQWRRSGRHIVVAKPSSTYCRFHNIGGWLDEAVYRLSLLTKRQLVVRDKESKRDLREDLDGAHALVTHGSITAVEAAILGCPVFVDKTSAAALVGQTDLAKIEHPVYPDRDPWLRSLAYCQFSEDELVNGVLWSLLE